MIRIGTAGWSIPRALRGSFGDEGPLLSRYAAVLPCVEIDSSFYRPHRRTTYARWADETPDAFRFAVKLPRSITHDARLIGSEPLLDGFLDEVGGLGVKLGVLLVQLPPSLAFDAPVARAFFAELRQRHAGPLVCEPRHATWFESAAECTLRRFQIARVAADPALLDNASRPGGWQGADDDGRQATRYRRWHGSPRMYWSTYDDAWLVEQARLLAAQPSDGDVWCIFDNTAAGAALANALALQMLVGDRPTARPSGLDS